MPVISLAFSSFHHIERIGFLKRNEVSDDEKDHLMLMMMDLFFEVGPRFLIQCFRDI